MPTQRTGRRFARGTLFIFLFAACGWLLLSHRRGEVMTPRLLLLDIGLAALAAMILSAAGARQTGIHGLMRPLLHWRIGPQWYLLALLLFPGLSLLGALISWGPGLTSLLVQPFSPPQQWPGLLLGSLLNTCLFAGPLGAEPGWRGFLLPRLQERNSPLLAALQIGVIWTAWQIPLYLNGFYPALPQDVPNMLLARLGLNMLLSIVLTWLILRSRGSLLLAILMHASFLLSLQLIPLNNATLLLGAVTALAIVVAERLWRRSDALG